jgi:pimeloyl-ACP methyl ester carboxylesterase
MPSTFILVPGAWHGGWAWQPVARRLRAAGHAAVTVTLPGLADGDSRVGLTLADAVEHVVREVDRQPSGDIVLVAHSWGGYPVTGAVQRLKDRISRVVYYNAMVPAPGVAMIDENETYAQMLRDAIGASPDGSISVALEQMPMLMPDQPAEVQKLVFELLVPQPGGYFLDPLDGPDVRALGVPATYVLGVDDRTLARPGAEFAARIGLTPIMISGSHESLLSRPDEVAEAILRT